MGCFVTVRLSNREVVAISQDPWGVQCVQNNHNTCYQEVSLQLAIRVSYRARRVASTPPPHADYKRDNLGLLAPCNATDPLQKWRYLLRSIPH